MNVWAALIRFVLKAPHKSFVGSHEHQQVTFITASVQQWMMKVFVGPIGQSAEDFDHLVRKRTRSNNAILRTLELRSRDHLHGLGDLLRVLDRLYAPADVEKIRHLLANLRSALTARRSRQRQPPTQQQPLVPPRSL